MIKVLFRPKKSKKQKFIYYGLCSYCKSFLQDTKKDFISISHYEKHCPICKKPVLFYHEDSGNGIILLSSLEKVKNEKNK